MSILEHLLTDLVELVQEWQHLRQFSDLASAKECESRVNAKKQEILDRVFTGENLEYEHSDNENTG